MARIYSGAYAGHGSLGLPDLNKLRQAEQQLTVLLPSVQVMRQLSKSLTTAELRTLFDTCLTYRAGQPDTQGLPTLFWASADYHNDKLPPQSCAPHAQPNALQPPALWLETMLRQSVLNETELDQLYTYRGQLTSDQVVDILFRMDQQVLPDTVQQWQLLLGEKHDQALKTHPPWLDGSDEAMETVREIEDVLRNLFPDAVL